MKITNEKARAYLKEMFQLFDVVEESDSGHEFQPTYISTVRVMHSIKLQEILPALREWAFEEDNK